MAKVTLYILNYNYGRFVQKAVDSALAQTYGDCEILIIDDGSTDESLEVLDKYRDIEKVKIINQKNAGLIKSIVKAFDMAKGKYVVRLDADDWLDEHFLEKLVKKIEENDNIALVFPDYYEVDELGQVVRRIKRHDFSENVTMYDQPAHGACTLIRKSAYKDVGGHNTQLTCQDGVDIWLSLIERYDVVNVNEPLFYYRKHSRSLTVNEDKILLTRSSIFREHARKRGYAKEKTVAFVPVRSQLINDQEYALTMLGGKTVLNWVIGKARSSELVDQVVVLTDSKEVFEYASRFESHADNIVTSMRDRKDALSGISIRNSLVKYLATTCDDDIENIVVLTLDYPFSRHNYIDTAIYSMYLFGGNSIDSVIMDNSIFYFHDGNGLKPWTRKDVRLEREDFFIRKGGVSVFKRKLLEGGELVISEKMGHVIVDKISSFEIRSSDDIEIANFIATNMMPRG